MVDGRKIQALIERFDRASDTLESRAVARLHRTMDAAFRQLIKELRIAYPELQAIGGLIAAQQKTLVLERLGGLLDMLDPNAAGEYEQLFQELLNTTGHQGETLASELLTLYESGTAQELASLTDINIEAVANQASEGVRRLYRHSEDFRDQASVIIGQGLIQGWGSRKVERALRSQLGLTKGKAETIARTETMAALNNSAIARYRQAGVNYVQWVATNSEVCGFCSARNMKVYKANEVVYPIHPRERCGLAPWKPEWQADGLTDDTFAIEYRQQGLDELAKRGGRPNSGVTSFEKRAGLARPPKAVWSPRGERRPQSYKNTPISVLELENQIREQRFEFAGIFRADGQQIFFKDGEKRYVEFSGLEVLKMKDAIITHNHPGGWSHAVDNPRHQGSSFSKDDWILSAAGDVIEMRAVSPGWRHSIKRPESGWPAEARMRRILNEADEQVRDRYMPAIIEAQRVNNLGRMQSLIDEAESKHWHEVAEIVSQKTGASYTREKYESEPWK